MLTKEQIAERIAAAAAKRGPKLPPIDNTELVAQFRDVGGQIFHLPAGRLRKKGVTFAFVARNNRMEVATALQHSNDCFAKKMGTKTAIEHFREGKTVHLPLQGDRSKALAVLRNMIG